MSTPLISIIIPIFNVEKYILNCLQSVNKQTYKNIEVIMVNDGSTDTSRESCIRMSLIDSRFKLFDKINGGLSDARNFGVNKCNGDYITFIDSDDYIDEDYIEYLYSLLKKNDVKMSICQHRTVFSNGNIENHIYHGKEKMSSEETLQRLLYSDEIDTSTWAKLYDRSLFEKVKFPVGKLFEDIATTYKLIIKSEYVAIGKKEKYNYIYRKQSIVNANFNLRKLDLIEMTDKMGDEVEKQFPTLTNGVIRRKTYARISTLNQMSSTKGFPETKKNIIHQIRLNGYKVLFDIDSPLRDKIALTMIYCGYPIYNFFWKKYIGIKKGI